MDREQIVPRRPPVDGWPAQIDAEKLFNVSLDMLCILGPDGSVARVNARFQQVVGWKPTELVGQALITWVHPDDGEETAETLRKITTETGPLEFQHRYRCAQGEYKHLRWTVYPVNAGEYAYAVVRDRTEQVQTEERFRLAIEASPIAMILVDERGSILYVNEQAMRLFEYPRDDLVGRHVELLVPPSVRHAHRVHRNQFRLAPRARPMGSRRDLNAVRSDGTGFPVEIGLNPIDTPEGTYTLAAVVDLSERKRAELQIAEQAQRLEQANVKLAEMASTDSLTSLWNRRSFLDQLSLQIELARRTGRTLSVLLLDIDYFKNYNDDFGHLAGDEVLTQVAKILRLEARRSDYVARIGGEEFGVILAETDRAGTSKLAQRFRAAIERASWPRRSITASVGATTAQFGEREEAANDQLRSQLLADADRALYYSKEKGRNRATHVRDIVDEP